MSYPFANQTDLESALGSNAKLALLTSRDGVFNINVMNTALNMASEDIEQYAVKLVGYDWRTTTPGKAKSACIDMAIYAMYKLTHRSIPASVQTRYDALIQELKDTGVLNSWNVSAIPTIQTIGRFIYNTPNTARSTGEVRSPRMSDAAETDWL